MPCAGLRSGGYREMSAVRTLADELVTEAAGRPLVCAYLKPQKLSGSLVEPAVAGGGRCRSHRGPG